MALVRGGITVKPHVQRAADELVDEFGPGLSPGTYNGHSPPEGPTQALDLFNQENQTGWQLQSRVADWLIKNAKRLGVRYVIKWDDGDWIWNIERAAEGWRAMATRDHRNHVHVTFYAKAEVEPEPVIEEEEMVYYGDSPDGREYAFWMVFGMFKKKLHTSAVWEEAQTLAKKMELSPPKHVGKIPVATFDGLIDVESLLRKGDKDGD